MEAVPESQDYQPTAETPLLQRTSRCDDEEPTTTPHPHLTRVVVIIIICIFLLELGDYMMRAPFMRVLEDITCRKFYGSTTAFNSHVPRPIPEHECKVAPVQAEIAMIKAWDNALSCIPAIFLAIPYGYVGDRYGRKIMLVLAVLGILLSQIWVQFVLYFNDTFDVRWIWAGNLFLLIGGGSAVSQNSIYAIVADVAPEAKRGPIFFQVSAAALISTVVGIPLSWLLMKIDPFNALLAASGFIALGNMLVLFLPETLQQAKKVDAALNHLAQDSHTDQAISPTRAKSSNIDLWLLIVKAVHDSRFILANPGLCALIFTFILSSLSNNSVSILFQLASLRFHWSLADASFLLPFSSVTNFVILIGILPVIYSVLGSRFGLRPSSKDLVVARGSLVFHILGALAIAFPAGPSFLIFGTFIFACGDGHVSASRSLLTSFVHPDQVSRLYAVLAIMMTIGSMVMAPLLSKAFSWGMDLGGDRSGVVFLTVAALYLVFGLPLWIIKLPSRDEGIHG
ncbi:hypothetical protein AnigIFM63309_003931 [Aspergillus niger]|nr:hypothetical protein AnigIFM63309_003931 [Aspergillus niger]